MQQKLAFAPLYDSNSNKTDNHKISLLIFYETMKQ